MAKKLRKSGTGASDTTVTPTGSGRLIYHPDGGHVVVYHPSGVEGSDTIYTEMTREPLAKGLAIPTSRHGD
jgi:hypothetical protein